MADAPPIPDWYERHGCAHAHCPNACPKPQPFRDGAELYCGRCWHERRELVPMAPCVPGVCED